MFFLQELNQGLLNGEVTKLTTGPPPLQPKYNILSLASMNAKGRFFILNGGGHPNLITQVSFFSD